MNWKRYAITVLAVLIAAHITGFVIHALILGNNSSRGGAFLTVAYLAFALGTVWIIAVWLVLAVPSFVIMYVVQPTPGMLTAKQLFWEFLNKILLGVITAALYRRQALP